MSTAHPSTSLSVGRAKKYKAQLDINNLVKVKWRVAGQIWWPTLRICTLPLNPSKCTHHTRSEHYAQHREHTPGAVTANAAAPGRAVGGLVPCLRSHTSVVVIEGEESAVIPPKSKWLDNWDCLGFRGIKKRIIVWWLCPHTAKTHLSANIDILHPMSP